MTSYIYFSYKPVKNQTVIEFNDYLTFILGELTGFGK